MRRVRVILVLRLLVAAAILCGCSTLRYLGSHTVEFELVTTSDWTVLTFEEPARISDLTISKCGDDAHCNNEPNRVNLNQSYERAEAGREVRLTGTMVVSDLLAEPLVFTTGRGHFGETVLRLYLRTNDTAAFAGEFSWSGVDENHPDPNLARFSVDVIESVRMRGE